MPSQGQEQNERFEQAYTDSFGFLRTALTGVTTWTDRQIRSTGVVLPHIAKGDIFSYNVQFPHSKKQDGLIKDFHLHIIPISAPVAGNKVTVDFEWGYYKIGDTIPNTLPNVSFAEHTFAGGEQYKHTLFNIKSDMTGAATDGYSGFFLIKLTRRNDASDTYAGEIAPMGADCHFQADRMGSYYETHD